MRIPGVYADSIIDEREQPKERDFAAERRADQIGQSALLKEKGWTEQDLAVARGYGFPVTGRYTYSGFVFKTREPLFLRSAIAKWRDDFKAFAEKVR